MIITTAGNLALLYPITVNINGKHAYNWHLHARY